MRKDLPYSEKYKYYKSCQFQQHKNKICNLLEQIPTVESPKGWKCKGSFSIGGFAYMGFSEDSDILFVASSNGRGLIDLVENKLIARDPAQDYPLDERLLICEGFDALDGKIIKLAGKYGGSLLPTRNKSGESLLRVSPLYPCEDIIFQPPFENCFIAKFSKNCVRIYRGYLYCYGFSFSGKYFVIADDGGITYWEAE